MANKIPPHSMAVRLGKELALGKPVVVNLEKADPSDPEDLNYILHFKVPFDADAITQEDEEDPPTSDSYTAFPAIPKNIGSKDDGSIKFRGSGSTIFLDLVDLDSFTTSGVKVRSGGPAFAKARVDSIWAELSKEEREMMISLCQDKMQKLQP
jgi:hypothetical protein